MATKNKKPTGAALYNPEWQELLNILDVSGPTIAEYADALEDMIDELQSRLDGARDDLASGKN